MPDVHVRNSTNNKLNRRLARRFEQINNRSKKRTWVLEEFTNGWSQEHVNVFNDEVTKVTNIRSFDCSTPIVDHEGLRSYLFRPVPRQMSGQSLSKRGRQALLEVEVGHAVAIQVPVLCTGGAFHEEHADLYRRLGLVGDGNPPKYVRIGGHGPTFGTLLAKVTRKHWVEGKFAGPAVIQMALGCNNCLDLLVGPLDEGKRRETNLPGEWMEAQKLQVRKLDEKLSKASGTVSRPTKVSKEERKRTDPNRILNANVEDPAAALETSTVVQLRARLKALSLPTTGVKAELIARLIQYN